MGDTSMMLLTETARGRGLGRRIAAAAILSGLTFLVPWIWGTSLLTAALIASAPGAVVLVGSSVSDIFDDAIDAVANAAYFMVGIVGVILSVILDIFD